MIPFDSCVVCDWCVIGVRLASCQALGTYLFFSICLFVFGTATQTLAASNVFADSPFLAVVFVTVRLLDAVSFATRDQTHQ